MNDYSEMTRARPTPRQMGVTFSTRPIDVLHNHAPDNPDDPLYAPTRIEYAGFDPNHHHYHLFRCVAEPAGGTAVIENKDGLRLCTFKRYCKDDEAARWVTRDGRFAFCDHHAMRYARGPCPWGSTHFCRVAAKLDIPGMPPERCSLCDHYEKRRA